MTGYLLRALYLGVFTCWLSEAKNSGGTCKDWLWPIPGSIECSNESTISLSKPIGVTFLPNSKSKDSPILLQAIKYFEAHSMDTPTLIERGTGTEPETLSSSNEFSRLYDDVELKVFVETEALNPEGGKDLHDDESYSLNVSTTGACFLRSKTIWGALYGLTTLQQLVVSVNGRPSIIGTPITISDAPRYPWRGILIDSVNHFLPVSNILKTVSVMAKNKMNVLHWHITDSYSFPFQSKLYTELSEKGAWHPTATYSHEDVATVEKFSRYHGVRVVMEVDQPGHAYSWGLGKPGITIACPSVKKDIGPINVVPFNPTLDETYATILGVIKELTDLVPGEHLHLGGDELQYGCWNESAVVLRWMEENDIKSFEEVTKYFFSRIRNFTEGKLDRKAVVWEDLFLDPDGNLNLNASVVPIPPEKAIVEVWTSPEYLHEVVQAGYDALLAYGWYLDRQVPVDNETSWFWEDTWRFMYKNDPESSKEREGGMGHKLGKEFAIGEKDGESRVGNILGGEASMWSEQVDPSVLDGRVWPRACAVAERLWSPKEVRDLDEASIRLNKHRCRLNHETGVSAGPIWAGFCASVYSPNTGNRAEYYFEL